MAQTMKGRAFAAGATAPRPTRRMVAVRALPKQQQVHFVDRVAPSMLAALVTLSSSFATMDAVYAPAARAEDEETMSPYEKRQAELEKRRELLREAREKAAARAAGSTYTAPEPAAAPAAPAAPSLTNSLQSYESATKNRPSLPAPAAEPSESAAPSAPAFGGFNFAKKASPPAEEEAKPAEPAAAKSSSDDSSNIFSSDLWNTPIKPKASAPAPVPAPAPAAPAPFKPAEPVKKAEPEKSKAAAAAKPGKRRGPLPLWFAEVLVLGAYAGAFLAVTKYSQQSGEVLKAVWAKVVEAYNALEKLISKNKQVA